MDMLEKLSNDLKTAMKNKDTARLEVLRMMKSKIMTVSTKGVKTEEALKILKTYAKNLNDAIEMTQKGGRAEEAQKIKQELDIVHSYLPKPASAEDIKTAIEKAFVETKPEGKKDFGKVMKQVMAQGLNADGKLIKDLVTKKMESL